MRRLVAALVIVMVAAVLAACGGAEPEATTPAASSPAAPIAAEATEPVNPDTASPTQTVQPYQQFPADRTQVPSTVMAKLQNKSPFILYWYDATTEITADQAAEFNAIMPKYRGLIELESIDYLQALPESGTVTPAGTPAADPPARTQAIHTRLETFSARPGRTSSPLKTFVIAASRLSPRK